MADGPWQQPGEPIHRYRRFTGWDYTKGASLFVTLTLEERRPLFGHVENCKMILSPLGGIVLEALESMPRLNPGLSLFGHVVMPDHVHFNCSLAPGLSLCVFRARFPTSLRLSPAWNARWTGASWW